MTYTPYATFLRGKTGDIIMLAQFEEWNLLSKNCDNTKSGGKFYDNSIMPPLISEEEMCAVDSGNESDDELTSK